MNKLNAIFNLHKSQNGLIAHVTEDIETTYLKLFDDFQKTVTSIQKYDHNGTSPILVYGHKSSEMISSFMACMYLGRPFIPVDCSLPIERIRKVIEISAASLYINTTNFTLNLSIQQIAIESKNYQFKIEEMPLEFEERTCYIIFTSGSSGEPKGVEVSYKALNDFCNWTCKENEFFSFKHPQCFINHALFSFDLSVFEIWTALVTKSKILSLDHSKNFNTRHNLNLITKNKANIWVSTPSFINLCLIDGKFNAKDLSHLSHFIFCGEILPKKTVLMLKERFPNSHVYNLYGPTEATCATTSILITDDHIKSTKALPVGFVKKDSLILISTDGHFTDKPNVSGEVIIVGDNVAKGYINRPHLTEQHFFKYNSRAAYRTGDLGYFDADKNLYISGRIDRQIKYRGYRIELEEIEKAILLLSHIDSVFCCLNTTSNGTEELIAVLTSSTKLTSLSLNEIRDHLPLYMIPSKFYQASILPINDRGKITKETVLQRLQTFHPIV